MGPKSHVYRAAVKKELCFEARTPSPSPPPSPSPSPSPSCRHRRRLVYLALVRAVAVASSLSRARGRSARTSLGSALAMETAAPRDRDCLWRDAARRLSAIAAPRRGRAARPLLSPHKRSRRQPFPFDWYSNSPPTGRRVCAWCDITPGVAQFVSVRRARAFHRVRPTAVAASTRRGDVCRTNIVFRLSR